MKAARRFWGRAFGVVAAIGGFASVAQAEVVRQDPIGFVVRTSAETTVSPAEAWRALVDPAKWWNPSHSFSGAAANLSLSAVPGGCFCEALPAATQTDPQAQAQAGGVEHMRVIYVEPFRVLRLTGALGPLQSEAVRGTWTITLKPTDKGTRILFEYVVGGYMRYTTDQIAPVVDKMMMEQLTRLAVRLGPVGSVSAEKVQARAAALVPPSSVPDKRRQLAVVPVSGSNLAAAVDRVMMPQGGAGGAVSSDAGQKSDTEAQESPQVSLLAPEPTKESVPVTAVDAATSLASHEGVDTAQGYVQRDFLVRLEGANVFLAPVGEDGEPVVARFAVPGLAQNVRQTVRAGSAQMSEGMVLHCLCTGSYSEDRGTRIFSLLDAVLEWR